MRLTTASGVLPGATRANYISLTTHAPPNLSPVEWKNAVPLAASPGTEHANGVWSLSRGGPFLLRLPGVHPSAGMKTKSALKKRCKDCFFVRRRGHLFVFCKTNPRHKQRQG
uniref:Ribosomal protein n=1 Tax=Poecilia mexicana TaxID=48701 RepID=A0A3B3YY25_9TELE